MHARWQEERATGSEEGTVGSRDDGEVQAVGQHGLDCVGLEPFVCWQEGWAREGAARGRARCEMTMIRGQGEGSCFQERAPPL